MEYSELVMLVQRLFELLFCDLLDRNASNTGHGAGHGGFRNGRTRQMSEQARKDMGTPRSLHVFSFSRHICQICEPLELSIWTFLWPFAFDEL